MATPSGGPETGLPFTSSEPELISVSPAMQRSNVVLPQPLGPTMHMISCARMERDNCRKATTVPSRNSLAAFSATIAGLFDAAETMPAYPPGLPKLRFSL